MALVTGLRQCLQCVAAWLGQISVQNTIRIARCCSQRVHLCCTLGTTLEVCRFFTGSSLHILVLHVCSLRPWLLLFWVTLPLGSVLVVTLVSMVWILYGYQLQLGLEFVVSMETHPCGAINVGNYIIFCKCLFVENLTSVQYERPINGLVEFIL